MALTINAFLQMVSLYRDPEGEHVFGNTLNTNEMNLNLVSAWRSDNSNEGKNCRVRESSREESG